MEKIRNEQSLDLILDNYIETQVHDTISLKEDIETIVLDSCGTQVASII